VGRQPDRGQQLLVVSALITAMHTDGKPGGLALHEAPLRVYWEVTRACDLACRHCRAEAVPRSDPNELSAAEGRRLLDALRATTNPPRVVLTGGDPLRRSDFWALLEHGVGIGLGVSVAPSATPLLTIEVGRRLRRAGAEAMSLSLDGADAARHDGLRGVPGCFDRTVAAARAAVAEGLPLQVNTLATAETLPDIPAIADLVDGIGAARWSLFFLVQVGRGRTLGQLSSSACETLLVWLWRRSRQTSVVLTTTEAPHYRRVVLQQGRTEDRDHPHLRAEPHRRAAFGIRDGNGIMFISHTGEVQPAGFLPLTQGNVRASDPLDVYRQSPLFQQLREPDRFGGRCGRCEYRQICGGSRSRAYAASGDPLGEDPLCVHEPGVSGHGLREAQGCA
jgi:AdoMet-dependent heme synthase